jgi:hypothetical protein
MTLRTQSFRLIPAQRRPAPALAFVVSLAVASALPRLASAQQQQQQDDPEMSARASFAVGRYKEALEIYGRLYAKTLHPTYLRNIGRCYQNMGQPDEAISAFHEYLRKARNLDAEQRAEINGFIAEMEALKQQRAREARAEAPAPAAAPATTPAPASSAAPPTASAPSAPAAQVGPEGTIAAAPSSEGGSKSPGWSGRKIAGVSLLGVTGAGLATGIAFTFVHDSRANDFNTFDGKMCGTSVANSGPAGCASRRSSAESAQTLAIGAYVVAGVAAAASAFLLLVPSSSAEPDGSQHAMTHVRCAPTAGLGFGCAGTF